MIQLAAVKIIDRQKAPQDYQEKFLPRELKHWPRLRHPNLIALNDWFQVPITTLLFSRLICSVCVLPIESLKPFCLEGFGHDPALHVSPRLSSARRRLH